MGFDVELISIIVPVYNVEKYLRQCLDSVINQTYRKLEILVVDDGSTDGSGKICDEYAEKDERIKVFHTENHGLSAARNLGLDHVTGEYIGFVDSDDWLDLDMYEILLRTAKSTAADIVECGVYEEYPGETIKQEKQRKKHIGLKAVEALLREELFDNVWNKLWRRQCFVNMRFPENRLFEDIMTTYRIFCEVECVQAVEECKYHYFQRKSGLSKSHCMKNLVDYWLAHYERYTSLKSIVGKESEQELIRYCAKAAARTWAYYNDCSLEERADNSCIMYQINAFMRNHVPLFGYKKWSFLLRVGSFFPHYCNTLSFRTAWMLNRIKGNQKLFDRSNT